MIEIATIKTIINLADRVSINTPILIATDVVYLGVTASIKTTPDGRAFVVLQTLTGYDCIRCGVEYPFKGSTNNQNDDPDRFRIDDFAMEIIEGCGGLNDYERHELVVHQYSDRVAAAVWTMRCLANPYCDGSDVALEAIIQRRREKEADIPASNAFTCIHKRVCTNLRGYYIRGTDSPERECTCCIECPDYRKDGELYGVE